MPQHDIVEKAFKYLPGGTLGNVPLSRERPIIIREGKGARVWDTEGREYIDYLLGSGPMILGHCHPAVTEAVHRAVDKGTTFFATNEISIELAEEIVKAVPCAEQVRFTASGTEATFNALRIARAFTGREKILKFEGGYHGMHDYSVMSLAPKNPPPFPKAESFSAGVPKAVYDTVLIAPFNDLETATSLIEQNHQDLAAVIVEPFQRLIPPLPGFLQGLREVTRRYEVPLIFDEVVTGFRLAYGGAQEYYGVIPDIATYGKIVGGGFPLAAVVGRQEIMHVFDPEAESSGSYVPQIGTLSGNPVASAAGLATLRELQKPGAYQRYFAIGRQLREGLQRMLQEAELPARVVGDDTLFDVIFTEGEVTNYRDTLRADAKMQKRFVSGLIERGIFRGGAKFYLSLALDQSDIDRTLEAFKDTINTLR